MKNRDYHNCSDLNEALSAAQKAAIDARLAEAEEDIKQARVSKPFRSAQDLARALRTSLREGAIRRAARDRQLAEETMIMRSSNHVREKKNLDESDTSTSSST